MCIRDRVYTRFYYGDDGAARAPSFLDVCEDEERLLLANTCLLYTSDAADERSSVNLGGRRIIKKKKKAHHYIKLKHSKHQTHTRQHVQCVNKHDDHTRTHA